MGFVQLIILFMNKFIFCGNINIILNFNCAGQIQGSMDGGSAFMGDDLEEDGEPRRESIRPPVFRKRRSLGLRKLSDLSNMLSLY